MLMISVALTPYRRFDEVVGELDLRRDLSSDLDALGPSGALSDSGSGNSPVSTSGSTRSALARRFRVFFWDGCGSFSRRWMVRSVIPDCFCKLGAGQSFLLA